MLSGEVLPHLCRAAHVLVVGTKSDLGDGERDIPAEEGKVGGLCLGELATISAVGPCFQGFLAHALCVS